MEFANKLPTLGMHYKAIPDPEPTLPKESIGHYWSKGYTSILLSEIESIISHNFHRIVTIRPYTTN